MLPYPDTSGASRVVRQRRRASTTRVAMSLVQASVACSVCWITSSPSASAQCATRAAKGPARTLRGSTIRFRRRPCRPVPRSARSHGSVLIMRFRFPLADGPYGLAYDDRRNLLWVSQTAANQVVGFDLSTGEPRERARFATVRQPDSITVDPESGAVFVLSAVGEGLQRVARG